jgi:hypothetical protein
MALILQAVRWSSPRKLTVADLAREALMRGMLINFNHITEV